MTEPVVISATKTAHHRKNLPTQAQFRRAIAAAKEVGLTIYGVDVARCIVLTSPPLESPKEVGDDWGDDEG